MKAVVYKTYGSPDVLQYSEVARPVPRDNEVLIKVVVCSLNAADWRMLRADPWLARLFSGLFRPKHKILGTEVSGTVEAVGSAVTRWKVGDAVIGSLFANGSGGLAEYVCAPDSALVLKPELLSFETAAALPMAAVTALQGVRLAGVQRGERVAVQGAAGGVGLFTVQLAHQAGAVVTAVCSARNADQVKRLGADTVIDYAKQDFTAGEPYDVILAVNGYHPLADYQRALKPKGRYVMMGGSSRQLWEILLRAPWKPSGTKKMTNLSATISPPDVSEVVALAASGKLQVVIDRRFALKDTADAFRYLEEGHARGKVLVTIS